MFTGIFIQWIAENAELSIVIITSVGSVIGFVLTRLYDRYYSDKFSSSSELLEKLKNQTLSFKGKKRLQEEFNGALVNLQSEFKNNRERSPESVPVNGSHRFYAKDFNKDTTSTSCPGNSENNCFFLFDTENYSQEPIYDLQYFQKYLIDKFSNAFSETITLLFKNRKIINQQSEITFWINAENYFPENVTKLNTDYNAIAETINKWIPGAAVILELYIPRDLMHAKGFINNPQIIIQLGPPGNSFIELVLNRNKMYQQFSEGYTFGKLGYVHKEIPADVLQARLKNLEMFFESEMLNIHGGPGTGKTFLTECLIMHKVKSKNLFIVLNNIELMNSWISIVRLDTRESFFDSIVNILIQSHSNLFPAYCTTNDHTILLAQFVLKNLLHSRAIQLYIVIDDYYLYKDLMESSISNVLEKKWGIKFLIVGRPESVELKERFHGRVRDYRCESWSMEDALKIISHWTATEQTRIREALKIDWLVNNNDFSIYLLRLISNNINNIENYTLSDILRKEITNSLNPVFTKLIGSQSKNKLSHTEIRSSLEVIVDSQVPDENKIVTIRDLLKKEVDITIDRFIRKIGELCWASKFKISEDDTGITDKGISDELIKALFPFLDLLQFRKIAMEAKIFKRSNTNEGKLDWNDNLISEGSLALLVKDDLNNISNDPKNQLEFSGLLEGLKKENSLNILSLIIDSNAILKMTKIITNTNLDRLDLIDDLLTNQNLNTLQKTKNGIGSLAQALIDGFSKREEQKYLDKISQLVKRISDFDDNYKNYLFQILGHDSLPSRVAQHALAFGMDNQDAYFQQMDLSGVDKFQSTRIAVSMWKKADIDFLVARLNAIEKNDTTDLENIKLIWRDYLIRYDAVSVLNVAETIALDLETGETRTTIKLVELVLNYSRERRTPVQVQEIKTKINALLNRSWAKMKYKFSGVIIKYAVFYESQDLFDSNQEWVVNQTSKYGLPNTPFGKNRIVEILGKMPEANFFIAKIEQIISNNVKTHNAPELVSDNLINGNIHGKQVPVNFTYVNFQVTPLYAENGRIEDFKADSERTVYWRPVYNF